MTVGFVTYRVTFWLEYPSQVECNMRVYRAKMCRVCDMLDLSGTLYMHACVNVSMYVLYVCMYIMRMYAIAYKFLSLLCNILVFVSALCIPTGSLVTMGWVDHSSSFCCITWNSHHCSSWQWIRAVNIICTV